MQDSIPDSDASVLFIKQDNLKSWCFWEAKKNQIKVTREDINPGQLEKQHCQQITVP